jgi:hypothetical protein
MPASDDPEKDREIFLKLMTMDRDALWRRKSKPIPQVRLLVEVATLPPGTQRRFFDPADETKLKRLGKDEKDELQGLVFERMNYAEKLEYCDRPEQIEGPAPEAWKEINAHLGTHAHSLPELVQELGEKRFGHPPRVGDAFCGGGSIPFEAARLGCDAYGSDLNPVAALLTWASLNLVGGGEESAEKVRKAQEQIYAAVDRQVSEWGIEHNSLGWRADSYLYCVEVTDPETGWKVPLLPSLAIAPKPRVIARLIPDAIYKRYEIEILEGVSEAEYASAEKTGTVKNSRLLPPNTNLTTPIEVIRQEMRLWEKNDLVPRSGDVFQERLYCIRWIETIEKGDKNSILRHYRAPNADDLRRDKNVIELLQEHLVVWQQKGYIPSQRIEPGSETTRLQRERGWTYWRHLFTPRQLLIKGMIAEKILTFQPISLRVSLLLLIYRLANWNSKLCQWLPMQGGGIGGGKATYFNNALNTMPNYSCRGLLALHSSMVSFPTYQFSPGIAKVCDARQIDWNSDIWITDPPYADAIHYEELSELFLSWSEKLIHNIFPDWYSDSKRALAVHGESQFFRQTMLECYKVLASLMVDNGLQVVMFTHQDAGVWADLSMILWAAGLRVTSAWTIATETDPGYKSGNYVQGTVLLVLRKRVNSEPVFLDEVNQQVEAEVRRQLDEMTRLEDNSDPNFGDADYQLAAYAAALRVLTSQPIEEINPEREILRPRRPGEVSPVETLIRRAVKIACDHLVPRDLDGDLWKQLNAMERFYIKGLEVESHGEYRSGVYQELARGFGANEYTDLLENTKANETRLKSATEFGRKNLSGEGFGGSLLRQCLFAVAQTVKSEDVREGLNYLKTELPDYWAMRERIVHILDYLSIPRGIAGMEHWQKDAYTASLLAGAVRNDHV